MYSKIKALCKKNNISVRELESKLAFSRGSICKWDVNIPGIDKVKAVADYFDVTIDELMEDVKDDKVKHLTLAKAYVAMAIHELEESKIVMVEDECWVSALNAAVNLYSVHKILKNAIEEMNENE